MLILVGLDLCGHLLRNWIVVWSLRLAFARVFEIVHFVGLAVLLALWLGFGLFIPMYVVVIGLASVAWLRSYMIAYCFA